MLYRSKVTQQIPWQNINCSHYWFIAPLWCDESRLELRNKIIPWENKIKAINRNTHPYWGRSQSFANDTVMYISFCMSIYLPVNLSIHIYISIYLSIDRSIGRSPIHTLFYCLHLDVFSCRLFVILLLIREVHLSLPLLPQTQLGLLLLTELLWGVGKHSSLSEE